MTKNEDHRTSLALDSQELLLLEEVAQQCRTSLSTVRHWIRTGRLKSVRPGRRRLVARREMCRFLGLMTEE